MLKRPHSDPWHKLSFDVMDATCNGDIMKMFRQIFGDDTQFSDGFKNTYVPAISMHSAFLPYNYCIQEITDRDTNTKRNVHIFQIACAGYDKEDVKVSRKGDNLIVNFSEPKHILTNKTETDESADVKNSIVHNQLTSKSGKISWFIKNLSKAEVKYCELSHGILTIRIDDKPIESDTESITIE